MPKKPKSKKQADRILRTHISMFLLSSEMLKNLFWNVKTVSYNKAVNRIRIGINTTSGKLGTTLERLRKTSRHLSDYLFTNRVTIKPAKVEFFVDREDEEIARMYNLIEKLEAQAETNLHNQV